MASTGRMGRAQRKEAGKLPVSQSGGSNLDDEETPLTRGDERDEAAEPVRRNSFDRDRDGGKESDAADHVGSNQDGKTDDDGPAGPVGGAAGGGGTGAGGGAGGGRRNRSGGNKPTSNSSDGRASGDDIENQNLSASRDLSMGPMRILEPIRADPVKALQTRQKRLERFAATSIPEIHFVGQITSGEGLIDDSTEGVCVRWKVDIGKAWEHLGGDTLGQTHIAYCRSSDQEAVPFNHPLDLHFAEAGLQGWGAPRIAFQCYKLDWHGRRLLVGYAFEHLPTTPGPHRMEVNLWRPVGSPEQELDSFLLGRVPALVSHEPLYESAWRERYRLVTTAAGKVFVDLFVVTRNMQRVGIDE